MTQICRAGLWSENSQLYRHLSLGYHYVTCSVRFYLCKKTRFRSEWEDGLMSSHDLGKFPQSHFCSHTTKLLSSFICVCSEFDCATIEA